MGAPFRSDAQSQPDRDLPIVLAVDDVQLSLLMIKEALKGMVNLYMAKSAADAIRVLGMVSVDLLLLDLGMPGVDGLDFLAKIRLIPQYEKMPVIIVSGNAKQSTLDKTLDYGVVDYIIKPFQTAILRDKVSKVLAIKA